ncbi:MAG TPA: two-component regulator propeller domain-containing protein, partial [Candidatus Limnocylindria bacterium]|nr:two-component regulator propeller domain-containing protein [Candidatus Limnocylindria bacterium]
MSNRVKAIFALSRILFLWGVVGLLIGGGNGSAASIELSDYSRDFVVQNWTVDDGLPQNSVLGITQTPDGYLWFATYNGLVRFDGVKFTVFDTSNTPEMGSSAVYAMHLAKDGRLCLIMEGGDFLVMQDGRFTRQNGYKGLPNGPLSIVAESPEGYLDVVEESPGGSLYSETASGAFVKTDLAAIPAQDRTDEIEADTRGWIWYKQGGQWWRSLGPQMAPFITGGLRLASR